MMSKIGLTKIKLLSLATVMLISSLAFGVSFDADSDKRISIKISKTGLNRISNPPYKIMQVTGDDSKFKIKHDEDGQNIYFMPLSDVGSKIEISIRNNASQIQDLVLEVANIKGQTINLKSFTKNGILKKEEDEDISLMLQSMLRGKKDKFFVQNIKKGYLHKEGSFGVKQIKNYKWKNLTGGVFKITNKKRKKGIFDLSNFLKRFENLVTFYPEISSFKGNESKEILIIQKIEKR